MNLQICVPYQKCVYNCPMCIARNHKHNYEFDNLYETNRAEYLFALAKAVKEADDIVITGECDPSQDMSFVRNIMQTILSNKKPEAKVEMQTHNYHIYIENLNLDVLAYSITNSKAYLKSYRFPKYAPINRIVILLTKEFEFLNKDNFDAMGFDQVTFKTLQYSEDENINKWIDENRLKDLSNIYEIVEHYNGSNVSVRLDTSCMAKGRYLVFRSDGLLYETWEAKNPIK